MIWTDEDSRRLTISLVAHDGYRMPLRRDDRAAAVRVMTDRGLDTETMADRLCLTTEALRAWASRQGVQLPPAKPLQPWWVGYACPSDASGAKRRREERRGGRRRALTTTSPGT